jgi:sporulation protein YlmC with PRC-barrel domain
MKVHHVVRREAPLDKTINIRHIVGKSVLSKGGMVVGKVSELRLNPKNVAIEGVLMRHSIFHKPFYIGKGYFSHLSHEAIILNIELSPLLRGKKVITSEGKVIGKVMAIERKGTRNDIQHIVVKSFWSRKFTITPSNIKSIGRSIILQSGYNVPKKYFWQKSSA